MKDIILVTGSAGFIGFHLCKRLIRENYEVIGIDNLNSYYEVSLKEARNKILNSLSREKQNKYSFYKGDIADLKFIEKIFQSRKPKIIINLAAQAGVRYSIENPNSYLFSNLVGFFNILECCRNFNIKHLIYASSSSVYGGNQKLPFSETDFVDNPVSLYAATKKSNELMAYSYSHLYSIPSTGLRFFTVYGPWGRPDMAPMIFAKALLNNEPLRVFNHGDMVRDFTYIDDIIESIFRLLDKYPVKKNHYDLEKKKCLENYAPHQIFNIGNSKKIKLMDFIEELEKAFNLKTKKEFLSMQPGDVKSTFADCTKLEKFIDFKPNTSIEKGVLKFVNWYKEYY
tara:strand:+ start:6957 stop:7979 length:1023 start_codon:yes stop_codon:yes gene_type:complete